MWGVFFPKRLGVCIVTGIPQNGPIKKASDVYTELGRLRNEANRGVARFQQKKKTISTLPTLQKLHLSILYLVRFMCYLLL